MDEKKVKILLDRIDKQLEQSHDESDNPEERKLILNERELLKKFGINGIASSLMLFHIGDLIKLTVEVGTEIQIIEARLMLYGHFYNTYFNEKEKTIIQVMEGNIIMKELIDIPDDDLHEHLMLNRDQYNKYAEGNGDMHK